MAFSTDNPEAHPGNPDDEANAGMGEQRLGLTWGERQAVMRERKVKAQVEANSTKLRELLGEDLGDLTNSLVAERQASWRNEYTHKNDLADWEDSTSLVVWFREASGFTGFPVNKQQRLSDENEPTIVYMPGAYIKHAYNLRSCQYL